MNGDTQCDIYKLLGKYQLVGYILTFLKDALFLSTPVWRAILRKQVLQSKTQTMKKELKKGVIYVINARANNTL